MFNNKIEMILLDMDGTLLNSQSEVSPKNKEILKQLISEGYKVAIATGRNYHEARSLVEDIVGLAYITNNGSYIVDFNGEVIFNRNISKEDTISLLKIIEKYPSFNYSLAAPKEIYMKNKFKFIKMSLTDKRVFKNKLNIFKSVSLIKRLIRLFKSRRQIDNIYELIENGSLAVQKIDVMGKIDEMESFKERIIEQFGDKIKLSSSSKDNLEINPLNISKGTGLKYLADKLGIDVRNSIAFGDGGNDLELLEIVGTAVAMANSEFNELKEKADIIAESNDDDGVAKVLAELL
ncbi:hypothetical protein U472_05155 [Orenia metallireducens]|uniref:Haloacid dehalogenase n=1 Tax=Orenia metallireducens TaxID=1413210 RepID=A0A1C0A9D3_9FIRM|nr:Cof-type HAD-IIB family hydrolase [Orenia metallireducens]OCL26879.1 hypothetical protein U472_05155 [Orenia metallireducens]